MRVLEIPIERIRASKWNANQMDSAGRARLRASVERFSLVVPLVVRPLDDGDYETVGGAQRLAVLREMDYEFVQCVVFEANDAEARLLAQALNHIQGGDDPGLRAEALRRVLEEVPQEDVLAVLPETEESLHALLSFGEADLALHLQAWQAAQVARLRHMTFQLVPSQLELVEEALEHAMAGATKIDENPNRRSNALYHLCRQYLQTRKETA